MPALLTRTSILPCSATPAATVRLTSSSEDTSPVTVVTLAPLARHASPTASSSSALRAVSTRSAPASASTWAKCSPSPYDAPVMSATLPSTRKMSCTAIEAPALSEEVGAAQLSALTASVATWRAQR